MAQTAIADERRCPAGYSLRTAADPERFHDQLREGDGSPVWDEEAGGWLVFNFDLCAQVQKDETIFANAYAFADETIHRIKGGGANLSLSQDSEHDKLRRFHLKLLSPSNVERYRIGHVTPVINATLDRLVGRETIDATADIADRIPPRVISSMLGIPYADDVAMQRLLDLNHELVRLIESGYQEPSRRERALAASAELNEVLRPYVVHRRDEPADDLISRVWREAADFGVDLDVEAALGLCRELYFAGSDTTVFGIANALYVMLIHPEVMEAVRRDRGKALAAVVEESLRLLGVVQFRQRVARHDTMLGDAAIRQGQVVYLLNSAANRDPGRFNCPAEIDMARKGPTNHLAFGRGSRSCVGAQLARVEMRDVLDRMLDRFPTMRLDPDAPPPVFSGMLFRRVQPLHIRLRD